MASWIPVSQLGEVRRHAGRFPPSRPSPLTLSDSEPMTLAFFITPSMIPPALCGSHGGAKALGLKTILSSAPFPEEFWGKRMCLLMSCYNGSEADGRKALAPLLDALPEPWLNWMGTMPYPAVQSMLIHDAEEGRAQRAATAPPDIHTPGRPYGKLPIVPSMSHGY